MAEWGQAEGRVLIKVWRVPRRNRRQWLGQERPHLTTAGMGLRDQAGGAGVLLQPRPGRPACLLASHPEGLRPCLLCVAPLGACWLPLKPARLLGPLPWGSKQALSKHL